MGGKMTGAELSRRVDRLIAYCDETGEPPVAYILRQRLGLAEEELEALRASSSQSVRRAVERLDEYRAYFWVRKGLKDPKWASFSTFHLKQLGYEGEGEEKGEVKLTVRMDGVGEGAFL